MKVLARFIQIVVFTVGLAQANARNSGVFSVESILSSARLPSGLIREAELIRTYGIGSLEKDDYGGSNHVYFSANSELWIEFKIDEDDRVNKPVVEILVSENRLSKKKEPPERAVGALTLDGVHIGDSIESVIKRIGGKFRKSKCTLGSIHGVDRYEVFPDILEVGTHLRFFVRDNRIIAFSIVFTD